MKLIAGQFAANAGLIGVAPGGAIFSTQAWVQANGYTAGLLVKAPIAPIGPKRGFPWSIGGWQIRAALFAVQAQQPAFFSQLPKVYAGFTTDTNPSYESLPPAGLGGNPYVGPSYGAPASVIDQAVLYDGSQDVPLQKYGYGGTPGIQLQPNLETGNTLTNPVALADSDTISAYLYVPPFLPGCAYSGFVTDGQHCPFWVGSIALWSLLYDDGSGGR